MNPLYSQFKRKFSMSMYKNRKIRMGEMSFCKDFISTDCGDLYPIGSKSADCTESVECNRYIVKQGSVSRLLCQFFPFATYETTFCADAGEVGFLFRLVDVEATLTVRENRLSFVCNDHRESAEIVAPSEEQFTLIVSCRPGAFDVYRDVNGMPSHLHTFYEVAFESSNEQAVFENSYVFLQVTGSATVCKASSYLDNGISIADIRPIKYEDGHAIFENGRIYFTASIRMQEGAYHGVFSWIPGTEEIDLTGALFYDCGDGKWRNYLAPVILYHREKRLWYVWVSSFEHEHILAYGAFEGDPRFGVNVIDVRLMEKATDTSARTDFVGFKRDEDPDLLYDKENDRWLLAICRIDPIRRAYGYLFFASDDPLQGFRYIGRGYDGSETGGAFVPVNGEILFVCGNDFKKTSDYRIYSKNGMQTASFNYPDGGFRGWGAVMPIRMGSRTRYFWLTFDRHNGSDYNWSYGNLYCFEA